MYSPNTLPTAVNLQKNSLRQRLKGLYPVYEFSDAINNCPKWLQLSPKILFEIFTFERDLLYLNLLMKQKSTFTQHQPWKGEEFHK